MPSFLPDTNCMVAAVSNWHVHHDAARVEIARRRNRGEAMISAAPALVEAYSVLTRMPPPYRAPAAACLAVLERNFIRDATVVALDGEAYLDLLRRMAADGHVGGRIYDAVIAACGLARGADALLTFNDRHFLPFANRGMAIVVPSADETRPDQA